MLSDAFFSERRRAGVIEAQRSEHLPSLGETEFIPPACRRSRPKWNPSLAPPLPKIRYARLPQPTGNTCHCGHAVAYRTTSPAPMQAPISGANGGNTNIPNYVERGRSEANISMVDGNGGKVQTLIAGTFEGYDAGKVKFFAKNGFIFCKAVAKLSNFTHICVIFSNFPACQKSPKP
jgi:hypothetical protein